MILGTEKSLKKLLECKYFTNWNHKLFYNFYICFFYKFKFDCILNYIYIYIHNIYIIKFRLERLNSRFLTEHSSYAAISSIDTKPIRSGRQMNVVVKKSGLVRFFCLRSKRVKQNEKNLRTNQESMYCVGRSIFHFTKKIRVFFFYT